MATGTLTVRAPDSPEDVERVVRETREKAVLDLLQRGLISAGKGAELLGISKHDFLLWMSQQGLSPFDESLTAEELRAEAERVRQAQKAG
jgi:predicted HTH domain antitoxin